MARLSYQGLEEEREVPALEVEVVLVAELAAEGSQHSRGSEVCVESNEGYQMNDATSAGIEHYIRRPRP